LLFISSAGFIDRPNCINVNVNIAKNEIQPKDNLFDLLKLISKYHLATAIIEIIISGVVITYKQLYTKLTVNLL
jgi:hypothetical protein